MCHTQWALVIYGWSLNQMLAWQGALSTRSKNQEIPGGGEGGGGVEITGKSSPLFNHSCPGLVSSSLEIEFNMTDPEASKYIISMLHLTNDWNILLQHHCIRLASTSFIANSAKNTYVATWNVAMTVHDRASEKLACHSKVTLELVRKVKRYRTFM